MKKFWIFLWTFCGFIQFVILESINDVHASSETKELFSSSQSDINAIFTATKSLAEYEKSRNSLRSSNFGFSNSLSSSDWVESVSVINNSLVLTKHNVTSLIRQPTSTLNYKIDASENNSPTVPPSSIFHITFDPLGQDISTISFKKRLQAELTILITDVLRTKTRTRREINDSITIEVEAIKSDGPNKGEATFIVKQNGKPVSAELAGEILGRLTPDELDQYLDVKVLEPLTLATTSSSYEATLEVTVLENSITESSISTSSSFVVASSETLSEKASSYDDTSKISLAKPASESILQSIGDTKILKDTSVFSSRQIPDSITESIAASKIMLSSSSNTAQIIASLDPSVTSTFIGESSNSLSSPHSTIESFYSNRVQQTEVFSELPVDQSVISINPSPVLQTSEIKDQSRSVIYSVTSSSVETPASDVPNDPVIDSYSVSSSPSPDASSALQDNRASNNIPDYMQSILSNDILSNTVMNAQGASAINAGTSVDQDQSVERTQQSSVDTAASSIVIHPSSILDYSKQNNDISSFYTQNAMPVFSADVVEITEETPSLSSNISPTETLHDKSQQHNDISSFYTQNVMPVFSADVVEISEESLSPSFTISPTQTLLENSVQDKESSTVDTEYVMPVFSADVVEISEESSSLTSTISSTKSLFDTSTVDSPMPSVSFTSSIEFLKSSEMIQLSSEDVQPFSEVVQPSSEEVQPFSEKVQSSSEELQPSSEELQPSSEEVQPSSEEVQPSSEEVQPSSEVVKPSSEEVQPSSEEVQLSNEVIQPSSEVVQLSSEEVQPSSEEVQPSSLKVQPPSEVVQPSSEEVQPSSEVVQLSIEVIQPSSEVVQPSSEEVQPSSKEVQPSSEVVQPSSEVVQPSSEEVQLSSEVVQSSSEEVQPSSEVIQPSSEEVQPSSEVIQPSSEEVQLPSEVVQLSSEAVQSSSEEVQPSSEEVQPSSVELQPSSDEVQPSNEEVQPSSEVVKPSSVELQPSSDVVQPSSEDVQRSSVELQPSSEEVHSSSEEVQSSSEVVQLSIEVIQPSSEVVQPSSEEVQPSSKEVQPSSEVIQPSSEVVQPSSEEVQLSSGEVQPSSEVVQSSSEEVQPSSEVIQPSSEEVQPSSEEVQPSSVELQPSSEEVQPSNEEVQPSSEVVKPSSVELQPSSDVVQPSSEDVQRSSVELQPSSEEVHSSSEEVQSSRKEVQPSSELVLSSSEDVQPSSEELQPSSEEIKPSSEEIQPSNEEVQPFSEVVQPSSEEVQPFSEKVQPSSEELQPSSEEVQSFSEELQPSSEEVQSFSEELQPSSEELQLSSEELQPSSEELQPSSEEVQPSSEEVQSSSEVVQLSSEVVQPTSEVVQSSSKEVQPSSEEVQPSSEEVQPSNEVVQPSSEEVQPFSEVVQLSSDEVQSSSEEVQPSSEKVQPSSEEVQPFSEEVQPSSDEVQSSSKVVQLSSEEVQPSSEEVQPVQSSAEVQPSTDIDAHSTEEASLSNENTLEIIQERTSIIMKTQSIDDRLSLSLSETDTVDTTFSTVSRFPIENISPSTVSHSESSDSFTDTSKVNVKSSPLMELQPPSSTNSLERFASSSSVTTQSVVPEIISDTSRYLLKITINPGGQDTASEAFKDKLKLDLELLLVTGDGKSKATRRRRAAEPSLAVDIQNIQDISTGKTEIQFIVTRNNKPIPNDEILSILDQLSAEEIQQIMDFEIVEPITAVEPSDSIAVSTENNPESTIRVTEYKEETSYTVAQDLTSIPLSISSAATLDSQTLSVTILETEKSSQVLSSSSSVTESSTIQVKPLGSSLSPSTVDNSLQDSISTSSTLYSSSEMEELTSISSVTSSRSILLESSTVPRSVIDSVLQDTISTPLITSTSSSLFLSSSVTRLTELPLESSTVTSSVTDSVPQDSISTPPMLYSSVETEEITRGSSVTSSRSIPIESSSITSSVTGNILSDTLSTSPMMYSFLETNEITSGSSVTSSKSLPLESSTVPSSVTDSVPQATLSTSSTLYSSVETKEITSMSSVTSSSTVPSSVTDSAVQDTITSSTILNSTDDTPDLSVSATDLISYTYEASVLKTNIEVDSSLIESGTPLSLKPTNTLTVDELSSSVSNIVTDNDLLEITPSPSMSQSSETTQLLSVLATESFSVTSTRSLLLTETGSILLDASSSVFPSSVIENNFQNLTSSESPELNLSVQESMASTSTLYSNSISLEIVSPLPSMDSISESFILSSEPSTLLSSNSILEESRANSESQSKVISSILSLTFAPGESSGGSAIPQLTSSTDTISQSTTNTFIESTPTTPEPTDTTSSPSVLLTSIENEDSSFLDLDTLSQTSSKSIGIPGTTSEALTLEISLESSFIFTSETQNAIPMDTVSASVSILNQESPNFGTISTSQRSFDFNTMSTHDLSSTEVTSEDVISKSLDSDLTSAMLTIFDSQFILSPSSESFIDNTEASDVQDSQTTSVSYDANIKVTSVYQSTIDNIPSSRTINSTDDEISLTQPLSENSERSTELQETLLEESLIGSVSNYIEDSLTELIATPNTYENTIQMIATSSPSPSTIVAEKSLDIGERDVLDISTIVSQDESSAMTLESSQSVSKEVTFSVPQTSLPDGPASLTTSFTQQLPSLDASMESNGGSMDIMDTVNSQTLALSSDVISGELSSMDSSFISNSEVSISSEIMASSIEEDDTLTVDIYELNTASPSFYTKELQTTETVTQSYTVYNSEVSISRDIMASSIEEELTIDTAELMRASSILYTEELQTTEPTTSSYPIVTSPVDTIVPSMDSPLLSTTIASVESETNFASNTASSTDVESDILKSSFSINPSPTLKSSYLESAEPISKMSYADNVSSQTLSPSTGISTSNITVNSISFENSERDTIPLLNTTLILSSTISTLPKESSNSADLQATETSTTLLKDTLVTISPTTPQTTIDIASSKPPSTSSSSVTLPTTEPPTDLSKFLVKMVFDPAGKDITSDEFKQQLSLNLLRAFKEALKKYQVQRRKRQASEPKVDVNIREASVINDEEAEVSFYFTVDEIPITAPKIEDVFASLTPAEMDQITGVHVLQPISSVYSITPITSKIINNNASSGILKSSTNGPEESKTFSDLNVDPSQSQLQSTDVDFTASTILISSNGKDERESMSMPSTSVATPRNTILYSSDGIVVVVTDLSESTTVQNIALSSSQVTSQIVPSRSTNDTVLETETIIGNDESSPTSILEDLSDNIYSSSIDISTSIPNDTESISENTNRSSIGLDVSVISSKIPSTTKSFEDSSIVDSFATSIEDSFIVPTERSSGNLDSMITMPIDEISTLVNLTASETELKTIVRPSKDNDISEELSTNLDIITSPMASDAFVETSIQSSDETATVTLPGVEDNSTDSLIFQTINQTDLVNQTDITASEETVSFETFGYSTVGDTDLNSISGNENETTVTEMGSSMSKMSDKITVSASYIASINDTILSNAPETSTATASFSIEPSFSEVVNGSLQSSTLQLESISDMIDITQTSMDATLDTESFTDVFNVSNISTSSLQENSTMTSSRNESTIIDITQTVLDNAAIVSSYTDIISGSPLLDSTSPSLTVNYTDTSEGQTETATANFTIESSFTELMSASMPSSPAMGSSTDVLFINDTLIGTESTDTFSLTISLTNEVEPTETVLVNFTIESYTSSASPSPTLEIYMSSLNNNYTIDVSHSETVTVNSDIYPSFTDIFSEAPMSLTLREESTIEIPSEDLSLAPTITTSSSYLVVDSSVVVGDLNSSTQMDGVSTDLEMNMTTTSEILFIDASTMISSSTLTVGEIQDSSILTINDSSSIASIDSSMLDLSSIDDQSTYDTTFTKISTSLENFTPSSISNSMVDLISSGITSVGIDTMISEELTIEPTISMDSSQDLLGSISDETNATSSYPEIEPTSTLVADNNMTLSDQIFSQLPSDSDVVGSEVSTVTTTLLMPSIDTSLSEGVESSTTEESSAVIISITSSVSEADVTASQENSSGLEVTSSPIESNTINSVILSSEFGITSSPMENITLLPTPTLATSSDISSINTITLSVVPDSSESTSPSTTTIPISTVESSNPVSATTNKTYPSFSSTTINPPSTLTPTVPSTTIIKASTLVPSSSITVTTKTPEDTTTSPPVYTPTDDDMMVLELSVKLEKDVNDEAFKKELETGLMEVFQEANKIGNRKKRSPRNVKFLFKRDIQNSQGVAVTKIQRDPSKTQEVRSEFYLVENGKIVPADTAVPIFNKFNDADKSAILGYSALGPVRSLKAGEPTTPTEPEDQTTILFIVSIVLPCCLVLILIIILIKYYACKNQSIINYKRGESLEDHNLAVDMEKGDIISGRSSKNSQILPEEYSPRTDRKVPIRNRESPGTSMGNNNSMPKKQSVRESTNRKTVPQQRAERQSSGQSGQNAPVSPIDQPDIPMSDMPSPKRQSTDEISLHDEVFHATEAQTHERAPRHKRRSSSRDSARKERTSRSSMGRDESPRKRKESKSRKSSRSNPKDYYYLTMKRNDPSFDGSEHTDASEEFTILVPKSQEKRHFEGHTNQIFFDSVVPATDLFPTTRHPKGYRLEKQHQVSDSPRSKTKPGSRISSSGVEFDPCFSPQCSIVEELEVDTPGSTYPTNDFGREYSDLGPYYHPGGVPSSHAMTSIRFHSETNLDSSDQIPVLGQSFIKGKEFLEYPTDSNPYYYGDSLRADPNQTIQPVVEQPLQAAHVKPQSTAPVGYSNQLFMGESIPTTSIAVGPDVSTVTADTQTSDHETVATVEEEIKPTGPIPYSDPEMKDMKTQTSRDVGAQMDKVEEISILPTTTTKSGPSITVEAEPTVQASQSHHLPGEVPVPLIPMSQQYPVPAPRKPRSPSPNNRHPLYHVPNAHDLLNHTNPTSVPQHYFQNDPQLQPYHGRVPHLPSFYPNPMEMQQTRLTGPNANGVSHHPDLRYTGDYMSPYPPVSLQNHHNSDRMNTSLHSQPVVHSRMARFNPYEELPPEPPAVRYHHVPEPNYLIQPEFPPFDAGIQPPEGEALTFYQEPFQEVKDNPDSQSSPTRYRQTPPLYTSEYDKDGEENEDIIQLLQAAETGNLKDVIKYVNKLEDVNASNKNGLTALHVASKAGNIDVVETLLERGANIHAVTKKGNTALSMASLEGHLGVVKLLIANFAKVNTQSQEGFTPLYMASQEGHEEIVRYLLNHGANQHIPTKNGFTPLAVALQQGHEPVVSLLIEQGSKGKIHLPAHQESEDDRSSSQRTKSSKKRHQSDQRDSSPRQHKHQSPRSEKDQDSYQQSSSHSNSSRKKHSKKSRHRDSDNSEMSSPRRSKGDNSRSKNRPESSSRSRSRESAPVKKERKEKSSRRNDRKKEETYQTSAFPKVGRSDLVDDLSDRSSPRQLTDDDKYEQSTRRKEKRSPRSDTSSRNSTPRKQYSDSEDGDRSQYSDKDNSDKDNSDNDDQYSEDSFYSDSDEGSSKHSTPRQEKADKDGRKSRVSKTQKGDYSDDDSDSDVSDGSTVDSSHQDDSQRSPSRSKSKRHSESGDSNSDSDSSQGNSKHGEQSHSDEEDDDDKSDNTDKKKNKPERNRYYNEDVSPRSRNIHFEDEIPIESNQSTDRSKTSKKSTARKDPQDLYSQIKSEMLKSYKDLNRKTAKNMPDRVENLTDDQLLLLYEFHRRRLLFQGRQEASVKAKVMFNETFLTEEIRRLKKQQQDAKKKMKEILDDAFPSTCVEKY